MYVCIYGELVWLFIRKFRYKMYDEQRRKQNIKSAAKKKKDTHTHKKYYDYVCVYVYMCVCACVFFWGGGGGLLGGGGDLVEPIYMKCEEK